MMALLLLGTISATITLGARKTALLVALIILPLSVPILIFGVLAGDASCMSDSALLIPAHVYLLLLGAFTAVLLVLAPLAGQAGLSAALEER
jgi:heme exporter protein B